MNKRLLIPLLIILSTLGCARHHWVTPEVSGVVIENETRNPIGDVEVICIPVYGKSPKAVKTDSDGSFFVDATDKIVLSLLLGDPGYGGYFLFRKEGYIDGYLDYGIFTRDVLQTPPPQVSGVLIELDRKK